MESFEKNKKLNQAKTEIESKKPTALAERVGRLVPTLFRLELNGLDKIKKEVPSEKHIIFLTTHMSDYDVPISIAATAKDFPQLKTVEASTHGKFQENPVGYIGRQIAGEENSFLVDYNEESPAGRVFNPDNYDPMSKSLEEGNSIVMAAYYDPAYSSKKWELPEKGGNGGVYLSQITPDSVIVPVAVDIESEKPFGLHEPGIVQIIKQMRPRVKVKFGEPIIPEKIKNIEKFAEILRKRENKEKITKEELEEFSEIHKELKKQSEEVMLKIAEMLPKEKRGDWNNKTK